MPSDEIKNHEKNRVFLNALADPSAAKQLLAEDHNYLHYRSSIGETPFHYVVIENGIPIAALLLEWGANINTQDDFGATPRMHAVRLGYLQMVRWLIDHGASVDLRDGNEETALSSATTNATKDIFDLLISLPRKHPIDYYYDDLSAHEVLNSPSEVFDSPSLDMRDRLIQLGLSQRYR
jgi:ankyrin repeat protein